MSNKETTPVWTPQNSRHAEVERMVIEHPVQKYNPVTHLWEDDPTATVKRVILFPAPAQWWLEAMTSLNEYAMRLPR